MIPFFYVFLIINTLGFLVMAYDKYLAKNHKRRISEKTLLTLVLIGGTLGSGLSMLIFRHKTAKRSYLLKFWAIILLQMLVFYFLYRYDIREKITL
ncbi:DUF1294 domain-containing protein [Flavobacterium sp. XN-5]|uniref:DUF1294 domain-containing protein n=1 Tax=Flavobacterium sp. XN-5 TaxID=2599390 RepID=UPI0011CAE9ED|nr:DUF1294 domain-containing protein [Flavobacterium sp. XN-5]NGY36692.1 DUF1294 domain-containing protein [Flavobacterium sp. XN-5]